MSVHQGRIAVVGAGAWGTALALGFAAAGHAVALWGRNVEAMILDRTNDAYLPGIPFPHNLAVVRHFEALRGAEPVVMVVPAQTLRGVCRDLAPHIEPGTPLIVCAKGIERQTGTPLSGIVAEELPDAIPAVLSGPTFATELAKGMPAAATLACRDEALAASLAERLSSPVFRLYHTTDVTGVELAGALKNVLAIACGIVIGSGLGENARAAIMTRGIAEIGRLSAAMGGRPETLMGLSGVGDIALSCSSRQSRNFSFGLRIAEGAHTSLNLAEGAATSEAVLTMAQTCGIEMPVAEAVHAIINGDLSIEAAVAALMLRPLKREEA